MKVKAHLSEICQTDKKTLCLNLQVLRDISTVETYIKSRSDLMIMTLNVVNFAFQKIFEKEKMDFGY